MCVVPRRQPLWVIKAARCDVDFAQEIFMLKGQLRATPRTETPRALRSRLKPHGLTAHEPELRPRHAEPRDERGAGGSTTDRAMAVCLIKGRTRCLITDTATKASTLQHCITSLTTLRLRCTSGELTGTRRCWARSVERLVGYNGYRSTACSSSNHLTIQACLFRNRLKCKY